MDNLSYGKMNIEVQVYSFFPSFDCSFNVYNFLEILTQTALPVSTVFGVFRLYF